MSRRDRDPLETVFTIATYIGLAVLLVGVFVVLADQPFVAAAWALLSSAAAVWFGGLYLVRVNDDNLRALATQERLAVEQSERKRTVAEVIVRHPVGKRVGDAERDVFADALRAHFAAGRLDRAELDDRLTAVLSAKTVDDLILAVHDLPNEVTGR